MNRRPHRPWLRVVGPTQNVANACFIRGACVAWFTVVSVNPSPCVSLFIWVCFLGFPNRRSTRFSLPRFLDHLVGGDLPGASACLHERMHAFFPKMALNFLLSQTVEFNRANMANMLARMPWRHVMMESVAARVASRLSFSQPQLSRKRATFTLSNVTHDHPPIH